MRAHLLAAFLGYCLTATAQTSITIPQQQVLVTIPAQTVAIPAATPAPTPTPTVPPAGWVYYNGVFAWAGAYNFLATVNYADKAGAAPGNYADAAITITGQWGGWQPFAPGNAFDTTPYKSLVLSLKPTKANQCWATGFDAAGDTKDGNPVTFAGPGITTYGPVPQVGVWGNYVIPLSAFALTNRTVFKFSVADCSGNATNLFYATAVGFAP
jgi:hypothetical protein